MQVWHTKTGKVATGPFEGHKGLVLSAAFSPDGHQSISCSADQIKQVWDTQTGEVATRSLDDQLVQIQDAPVTFQHVNLEADSTGIYDGSKLVNGWMESKDSKFLLWLPPYYCRGLWGPNVKIVIGTHTTKLCFTQFVHGTS